jgi:hypothetical protein
VDAKERIRHSVLGEGQYEQSEVMIRRLLSEVGVTGIRNELISVDAQGAEAAADWNSLKSGKTISDMGAPKIFHHPVVQDRTSVMSTQRLKRWA